jgi:hypothetical protein
MAHACSGPKSSSSAAGMSTPIQKLKKNLNPNNLTTVDEADRVLLLFQNLLSRNHFVNP